MAKRTVILFLSLHAAVAVAITLTEFDKHAAKMHELAQTMAALDSAGEMPCRFTFEVIS